MSQQNTASTTSAKSTDPKKKDEKKPRAIIGLVTGAIVILVVIVVIVLVWLPPPWFSNKVSRVVETSADMPDKPTIHAGTSEMLKGTALSASVPPEDEEGETFPPLGSEGESVPPEEGEPPAEESEGDDQSGTRVTADAVSYDAQTQEITIYSDALDQVMDEHAANKVKLKKSEKKLESLESELEKAEDSKSTLSADKSKLQAELDALKQQVKDADSGIPNLEKVCVLKIIDNGGSYKQLYQKKGGKKKAKGIKIRDCTIHYGMWETDERKKCVPVPSADYSQ